MSTIDSRHVPRVAALLAGLLLTSVGSVDAAQLQSSRPADVGLSAERLARLDAAMQAEVDAGRKAGIVVLIARRGRVAHLKAFGMADREANVPMRDDSLFRLYSMTKPITSVALLMLYEEGKFQLADPLEKYIPAFKGVQVLAGMDGDRMRLEPARRPPTIHDVFRHTAGFSYGFNPQDPIDRAYAQNGVNFDTATSLRQLVAENLPKVPLLYQPGDRWVYSVAHDVQAYLVEHFSGMPFDEFCRERIFEPLGMSDATFGVPKSVVSRYTANYAPRQQGNPASGLVQVETREGVAPASSAPTSSPLAAGYARYNDIPFGGLSISSTAMDYALFGQMLVNGGELNGTRLLGTKTVELMTSNNLPPSIPGIAIDAPGISMSSGSTGYGLGVSVLLDPARAGNLGSKGTFGWAGAASTWAILDPEEDLVLILMSQYMVADFDFAARFQTLAYQAIVD
jgi:CubicO group peptidase (beta-lactamase class C family)